MSPATSFRKKLVAKKTRIAQTFARVFVQKKAISLFPIFNKIQSL
jgi:hypothetical protein